MSSPAEKFDGVAVEAPIKHPFWWSARMTYALCAFLAMVMHLCMRNTLNFVILCMVRHFPEDYNAAGQPSKFHSPCAVPTATNNQTQPTVEAGDLPWTRSNTILIQGTFYYGYIITTPIAGHLVDKFGGKFFFMHSITAQALVFMLIPFFARISFTAAFVVHFLQGLIAGCGGSAIYQLFSTWAHSTERTALLSFAYGGYAAGALLSFPLSSLLCQLGWETSFYVIGTSALCFGISCHWLVYNSLAEHPRISKEEHDYLKATNDEKSTSNKVPWRKILTSGPVYAFTFTHFFHSYGLTVLTLMLPRFLKEAMGFSLHETGIYSAAPFLGSFLSKAITIVVCSRIENRPNINLTLFRRILYVVCNCITILFIVGIVYSQCRHRLIVVIITLCIGVIIDVAFSAGYWSSLLFIAPSYSGLLSGIANCLATACGFLAPLGISNIVRTGAKSEWDCVMFTLMAAYCAGAAIYGLFGSSKLQPWGSSNANNNNN